MPAVANSFAQNCLASFRTHVRNPAYVLQRVGPVGQARVLVAGWALAARGSLVRGDFGAAAEALPTTTVAARRSSATRHRHMSGVSTSSGPASTDPAS